MTDNHSLPALYEKSPLYQLFISLLIVMAGILLFSVFILAGLNIFDADSGLLENPSSAGSRNDIMFLRYILIMQDITLFIFPAIIIMTLLNPGHQFSIMGMKKPRLNEIVLVILLTFCIFPINSFTGQLNSGMHLPDWLPVVEQWMIEKEDDATRLIDILLTPDTFWIMILNVLMIAVLPAIGEELIFRGVFQKIFHSLFKSGHLAIWVTAFIFSAIHFQFFGFIPRFILGLVFGYLFLWSGTLWLPVISHFVNNAVPVAGAYIQEWETLNTATSAPLWKQMIGLTLPVMISLIILLYFRNKSKKDAEKAINSAYK